MQYAMQKWIQHMYKLQQQRGKKQEYAYKHLIISLNSLWKFYWDLFCMIIVVYVAITLPFRIGFSLDENSFDGMMQKLIYVIFITDILLTFCQETEINEEVVRTHREIALSYCKGWLLLDLLSVIPFELFLQQGQDTENINQGLRIVRFSKLYRIVNFLRLFRLAKAVKKMDQKTMQREIQVNSGLTRICFFVFIIMMLCHIMACVWCAMSEYDDHNWMVLKL
jgi:Ion transport protein